MQRLDKIDISWYYYLAFSGVTEKLVEQISFYRPVLPTGFLTNFGLVGTLQDRPIGAFFMSSYQEYWKDPKWQKKRLEILKRDNFKCKRCGNKEKMLAVHHGYYLTGNKPWEYNNSTLITLCEICHSEYHKHIIYSVSKQWAYLLYLIAEIYTHDLDKDICQAMRELLQWESTESIIYKADCNGIMIDPVSVFESFLILDFKPNTFGMYITLCNNRKQVLTMRQAKRELNKYNKENNL